MKMKKTVFFLRRHGFSLLLLLLSAAAFLLAFFLPGVFADRWRIAQLPGIFQHIELSDVKSALIYDSDPYSPRYDFLDADETRELLAVVNRLTLPAGTPHRISRLGGVSGCGEQAGYELRLNDGTILFWRNYDFSLTLNNEYYYTGFSRDGSPFEALSAEQEAILNELVSLHKKQSAGRF